MILGYQLARGFSFSREFSVPSAGKGLTSSKVRESPMKSGAVVSCRREPAQNTKVARSFDVIPGQDNGHIVRSSAFKGSAYKLASGPIHIGSLVQHAHDLRLIDRLGQPIGAKQK
jgi:hypothetical protein